MVAGVFDLDPFEEFVIIAVFVVQAQVSEKRIARGKEPDLVLVGSDDHHRMRSWRRPRQQGVDYH